MSVDERETCSQVLRNVNQYHSKRSRSRHSLSRYFGFDPSNEIERTKTEREFVLRERMLIRGERFEVSIFPSESRKNVSRSGFAFGCSPFFLPFARVEPFDSIWGCGIKEEQGKYREASKST
jgi:hypothetical protein